VDESGSNRWSHLRSIQRMPVSATKKSGRARGRSKRERRRGASGWHRTHRWRGMDSKIQFRDLGRERDRKFCRLPAGASRIRTPGPTCDCIEKEPELSDDEVSNANENGKIAASSKAKPVATTPENIGFIAVKFALHDGSFETVLLDYFSARVSGQ
jgi:hypothetical protein